MELILQSVKNIRNEMRKYDDKDFGNLLSIRDVDKTTVIQNIKQLCVHSAPLYKCRDILTALLYMIFRDTKFTESEANEVFFCLTQLFTKRDPIVKRLLHIAIKELSQLSNDAIIATSSLIKDINTNEDFYKPSAMRALVRVTDKSMIGSIERYLKQAIVSNYIPYASAALVSAYNINNPDLLKKWTNEITQVLECNRPSVEYHALGVAYLMRIDDRFAHIKMISKYGRSINSPMAVVFMIRVCASLLHSRMISDPTIFKKSDINSSDDMKILFGFLSICLNTRNDIIGLEACRACISLKSLPMKILQLILNIFKVHMNSYKGYVRFAAIRSLYDMINSHPYFMDTITKEMKDQIEFLSTDDNRNVCMYAIIISLKLAGGKNIKRALKMVSQLMKELPDEFRIEIVKHMAIIASKYSEHGDLLLKTFDNCLRNEGGYEFKNSVVSSIVALLQNNQSVRKSCLHSLCEYLEDCEYARLSIKIIRHLGAHIHHCNDPATYVRYIFNRILLEKSEIRLAAVRCLAHIACQHDPLLNDIIVLLKRCLGDPSDNIRMEADMYCRLLQSKYRKFAESYLCPSAKSTIDIHQLKYAVSTYLSNGNFTNPCDVDSYQKPQQSDENLRSNKIEKAIDENTSFHQRDQVQNFDSDYGKDGDEKLQLEKTRETLKSIDVFQSLGDLLSMSKNPINLTEEEFEYVVKANKYVFEYHVAIEFVVNNTVKDLILDMLTFEFTPPEEFTIISSTVSSPINFGETKSVYFILKVPIDPLNVTGYCTNCRMKFRAIDSISNAAYEDQYDVEDVPIVVGDYISGVETFSFDTEWNSLGTDHELNDGFLLSKFETIESAVENVSQLLSMAVIHDNVVRSSNSSDVKRVLKLFGAFKMKHQLACILEFSKLPDIQGVALNAFFRSSDPVASEIIVSSLYN